MRDWPGKKRGIEVPKVYVDTGRIQDANYDLPFLEEKARMVKRRVWGLKREIPGCIADRYRVSERIAEVCREIGRLEERIERLHHITDSCVQQYAELEEESDRNAQAFL